MSRSGSKHTAERARCVLEAAASFRDRHGQRIIANGGTPSRTVRLGLIRNGQPEPVACRIDRRGRGCVHPAFRSAAGLSRRRRALRASRHATGVRRALRGNALDRPVGNRERTDCARGRRRCRAVGDRRGTLGKRWRTTPRSLSRSSPVLRISWGPRHSCQRLACRHEKSEPVDVVFIPKKDPAVGGVLNNVESRSC